MAVNLHVHHFQQVHLYKAIINKHLVFECTFVTSVSVAMSVSVPVPVPVAYCIAMYHVQSTMIHPKLGLTLVCSF